MESGSVKRIGWMGGSFNPPTKGHLWVAGELLHKGVVDRVGLVVSGEHPDAGIYTSKRVRPPFTDRYRWTTTSAEEMTSLSSLSIGSIFASDVENRTGASYSCDVMAHLKREYPNYFHVWVVGVDVFNDMEGWHRIDEFFQVIDELCVVPRKGYTLNEGSRYRYHPKTAVVLDVESPFEVSSTQLRKDPDNLKDLMFPRTYAQWRSSTT